MSGIYPKYKWILVVQVFKPVGFLNNVFFVVVVVKHIRIKGQIREVTKRKSEEESTEMCNVGQLLQQN